MDRAPRSSYIDRWQGWQSHWEPYFLPPNSPSRPGQLGAECFLGQLTVPLCFLMGHVLYLSSSINGVQGWPLVCSGPGPLKLGSLVWGALCSLMNTLFSQVGPPAKGPTPMYLKRKTSLYVVERAYCSQWVLVCNFSGSFGWLWRGSWGQNANQRLARHQHADLRELEGE